MSRPETDARGQVRLADAALERWDAVIIGCGVAGLTVGYGLAKRGQRVLFIEAGLPPASLTSSATYPEMTLAAPDSVSANLSVDTLLRHGRQTSPIHDISARHPRDFIPFIGKGAGGSSRLYGMAMERFRPHDFKAAPADPTNQATRPEAWPIEYAELADWYSQAEVLYGVRGGRDPLFGQAHPELPPPPPLDAGHAWLNDRLVATGLSTYRLPLACRHVQSCIGCQGHLCQKNCKIGSAEACLGPALETGRAHIAYSCVALRLEATRTEVTGVICQQGGVEHKLQADRFVLALGALYSPVLLLRSANAAWPQGVANRSGRVGRGLMRHGIDLYAFALPEDLVDVTDNRGKTLAFNDFYGGAAGGWGTVQSFGRLPPVSMLASETASDLKRRLPVLPKSLADLGARALSPLLRRIEGHTLILAATMEDGVSDQNFVAPGPIRDDPGSVTLRYVLSIRDQARMHQFRKQLDRQFKGLGFRRIGQMTNNERIAHACGTCRAGCDPQTSVVNGENRAHDLDNLWVCDASFMPSSGGTNPSLTIAANALRVAACM